MASTLEDAIILAARAHQGEFDEEGQPKIFHVLRVMLRFNTPIERIVAVLHDLVEDTDIRLEELRAMGYEEEILEALDCLTRREDEFYEQFIVRAKSNPIAQRVKIAELQDSVDLRRLPAFAEEDIKRVKKYQNILLQFRVLNGTFPLVIQR